MARGLNDSWGDRTEDDVSRRVDREALPQSLASQLHRSGKTSQEVMGLDDDSWSSLTHDSGVTRDAVADYLRVQESYRPTK